jgi:hypothetical protein
MLSDKTRFAIVQLWIQKTQPRSQDGATVCRRLSCVLSALSQHTAEQCGRIFTHSWYVTAKLPHRYLSKLISPSFMLQAFLVVFAQLRKPTITFVMPVCQRGTWLPKYGFSLNFVFEDIIWRENSSTIKSDNNVYLAWKCVDIYLA